MKVIDLSTGASQLSHATFVTAVCKRYFLGGTCSAEFLDTHRLLAIVLLQRADPTGDRTWQGRDVRALSEVLYHFEMARMWSELHGALCSLAFIQARCCVGLGLDLLVEYTTPPLLREHKKLLATNGVLEFSAFISRHMHVLSNRPSLVFQQAWNDPAHTAPCVQAHAAMSLRRGITWLNKPDTTSPCTMTIAGFLDTIFCVCLSPDGTLLACGSAEGILRIYDTATGSIQANIAAHGTPISAISFVSPTTVCTASWDTKMVSVFWYKALFIYT